MGYYDDEMTDRAVRAYFRRRKSEGYDEVQIAQPNRGLTTRQGNTITIANINGVLARYVVVKRNGVESVRWKEVGARA